MRVPVVSMDGDILMPTTPARARKLIKAGVAKGKFDKNGVFYIKMLVPVGKKKQKLKNGDRIQLELERQDEKR